MAWVNTGRMRFRQTRWLRRVVVQVQQRDSFYTHYERWKDATLDDMQDAVVAESARNIEVPHLRVVRP